MSIIDGAPWAHNMAGAGAGRAGPGQANQAGGLLAGAFQTFLDAQEAGGTGRQPGPPDAGDVDNLVGGDDAKRVAPIGVPGAFLDGLGEGLARPPVDVTVDYAATLPLSPGTERAGTNADDAGLIDAALKGGDISADQIDDFLATSLDGGTATLVDGKGEAVEVKLRWAKTEGEPPTWNLYYLSNPEASGDETAWTRVDTDFTFDADGKLVEPSDGAVTLENVSLAGEVFGDLTLDFGSDGLTVAETEGGTVVVDTFAPADEPPPAWATLPGLGEEGAGSTGPANPVAMLPPGLDPGDTADQFRLAVMTRQAYGPSASIAAAGQWMDQLG